MTFDPFPELDSVVGEDADHAVDVLGDDLVGVYVEGSFALGAGDPYSDVDFMDPEESDTPELVEMARANGGFAQAGNRIIAGLLARGDDRGAAFSAGLIVADFACQACTGLGQVVRTLRDASGHRQPSLRPG